jgi:hypothetical protein
MSTHPATLDRKRPAANRPSSARSIELLRELVADKPARNPRLGRLELQRRLARVEQQIAHGRPQFARQLELVAEIELNGGDAAQARETLRLFAQAHVIRLDDRDRLARLLELS